MSDAITVHIDPDDDNTVRVDPATGAIETDTDDGGVVVQLNPQRQAADGEDKFYDNLALEMPATELSAIANELIDAIQADDTSRSQYLQNTARALGLLGIQLEEPRSAVGDSGVGEGMSSVTNPLLLNAVLKSWANARAELLPAEGPVKIDNQGDETQEQDDLADALERGMNEYLTVTAPEYPAETSHMLLWGTVLKGSGFKKVSRCPMRRRPVSEMVDAKDLIVSDTTKDLRSCGRITHQILMRPSVMKRMKLLGAYRDVALTQPNPTPNVVDEKIATIQGTQASRQERPEDQPYTLLESQCELDIPRYAPGKFKDEGIPLPYLVTIDKDSREILALTRNWDPDDQEVQRDRMYVRYPYVPGPGFYGTGLLNILGNASAAMTAAWREALDAGMYANFPGGLISKLGGRQNTSNFRANPGEFPPIETGGMPINQVVMPFPYKDITPGLLALMDKITEQAKEVGGQIEMGVGEGLKDIPVGTMLAQLEQATKIIAAAHKDMHQAQAEEIGLFVKLFRRHPEDFWRGNKSAPEGFWDEQKLTAALNDHHLVPRSDPNTPSHIHRVMKAIGLLDLLTNPMLAPFLSAKEVLMRCLRALREDPKGLVVDPPPQAMPQGDPAKMLDAQARNKMADAKTQEVAMKAQTGGADATVKVADIQSKERIAGLNLQREEVIHRGDAAREERQAAHDQQQSMADHGLAQSEHAANVMQGQQDHALERDKHALEAAKVAKELEIAEKVANKPVPKPSGKK